MFYRGKKWQHICFFSLLCKNQVDFYNSLPLEKILTLHNAIILIKSLLNKDQNHYYYNIFLENIRINQLKHNEKDFFETWRDKSSKRKVLQCKKNPKNIWDDTIDNIVISKLIKTKTNSKYLIGYLDEVIRPLVLILPKMSRFIKTFKVKDGNKDKNNKSMSFHIDDEKLFEKHKTIWAKTEDIKNIKFNALPVYDNRYIKTKIRKYYDKVYTNFHGLNVPEDDAEGGSFTVISIDSLLTYKNNIPASIFRQLCL